MLQARYDLNCVLKETESGKEILSFEARQAGDYTENAGFDGTGIGSGGHSFSIATSKNFAFEPYNHKVYIKEYNLEFIVTSRRPIRYRRIGEMFAVEDSSEFVLELE